MDETNPLNTGNGQAPSETPTPIQVTGNPAPSVPTPIVNPIANSAYPLPEQNAQIPDPNGNDNKGKKYIIIAIVILAVLTIGYVVYGYVKADDGEAAEEKTDTPPGIEFSFDSDSKPDELETVVDELKNDLSKEVKKEKTEDTTPPSLSLGGSATGTETDKDPDTKAEAEGTAEDSDTNPEPPVEDTTSSEEGVTAKISR